jgi:nucleotide-binding universal stress UspA family protein
METLNKTIVVPWDFTPVAENALKHAVRISKAFDRSIEMVHIANTETDSIDIQIITSELAEVAKKMSEKYDCTISHSVVKGELISALSDYARQNSASLVVMGTHGVKGLQKVSGSKAWKIIISSRIPFLVVHNTPSFSEKINNIVLCIAGKISEEKLNWAATISIYFNSHIHILKDRKRLDRNEQFKLDKFIKTLIQNNIKFEQFLIKTSRKKYRIAIVDYARNTNADMIIIDTSRKVSFFDFFFGIEESFIIDNHAHIPVMCVNSQGIEL